MNFGIGVVFQDVSLNSRSHSKNSGLANQKIARKSTKPHFKEGIQNETCEQKFSQRRKLSKCHDDISHAHQIKEDNVTSSTKSETTFQYVNEREDNDRKSQNEYSLTPTRAILRKHETENNLKSHEDEDARRSRTAGSPILSKKI